MSATEYRIREEQRYIDAESTVEIADDERLLDAEYRGANRVVMLLLTPVENYSCQTCGETFDSERGLKIHSGSVHDA